MYIVVMIVTSHHGATKQARWASPLLAIANGWSQPVVDKNKSRLCRTLDDVINYRET
jgi:hypothetical protein